MAKIENYRDYFAELAKKAGLTDEQAKPVLEALSNEAIHRVMKEGFKALPDYSFDLDQVRDTTKASSVAEAKKFYDDWFATTGKPAYDEHVRVANEYKQYQQRYGALDRSGGDNGGNTNTFSKDDAQKLIDTALAARDAAYVGLTKAAMRVAVRHLKEYGEVLDPDDLEKFATEHKFSDINTAYDAYVKPKADAAAKTKHDKEIVDAKAEGAREALSRHKIPADSKPREYINPFLSKPDIPKDADPEKFARDAFLEGWNTQKE